jgi:hypothetical protein
MSASAEETPLPPVVATQVALIRDQFADAPAAVPEAIRRFVDAAALNLCEHVEVDMEVLNAVLGLRAAAEMLALAREEPDGDADFQAAALARARGELAKLEAVLANARPSAITVALGLGW